MKVLLIGPSGRIGMNFINDYYNFEYNKNYELILGMRDPSKINDSRFEKRKMFIENIETLKSGMKDIDVVLNLAANANQDSSFEDLINPNIIGTYNILESARIMNIKRVIMASSVHAVKGYDKEKIICESDAPRPINFYGATKAFVEAMCHVYYKKYGMSCIAIRIGAYISDDNLDTALINRKDYDYVISQRDMAQLLHKTIIAPLDLKYAVLNGSSDNKNKKMHIETTKKLVGYNPQDDSYKLKEEILKKQHNLDMC